MKRALIVAGIITTISSIVEANPCKPNSIVDMCEYAQNLAEQFSKTLPSKASGTLEFTSVEAKDVDVHIYATIAEDYRRRINQSKYPEKMENRAKRMMKNFAYQFVCDKSIAPETITYHIEQYGTFSFTYSFPNGDHFLSSKVDACF